MEEDYNNIDENVHLTSNASRVTEYPDVHEISRVKKKRKLTEKQQNNWKKAREAREKNIALRKQAKTRLEEIEREHFLKDPEFSSREKILKDMIMLMLSNDLSKKSKQVESITEKVVIPRVKNEVENSNEDDVHQQKRSGRSNQLSRSPHNFEEEDLNINIFKD